MRSIEIICTCQNKVRRNQMIWGVVAIFFVWQLRCSYIIIWLVGYTDLGIKCVSNWAHLKRLFREGWCPGIQAKCLAVRRLKCMWPIPKDRPNKGLIVSEGVTIFCAVLLGSPFVTAVCIGASKPAQVVKHLRTCKKQIDDYTLKHGPWIKINEGIFCAMLNEV